MVNKALFSSAKTDWETPQSLFDALDKEFRFVLDAAATEKNAKCASYFTPEQDGLIQCWGVKSPYAVFCNPPYGRDISKWVRKAWQEAKLHGITIVMLLPARTNTAYFHDYILGQAEIRFLRGRLKFLDSDGHEQKPTPFPSMIVIYNGRSIS